MFMWEISCQAAKPEMGIEWVSWRERKKDRVDNKKKSEQIETEVEEEGGSDSWRTIEHMLNNTWFHPCVAAWFWIERQDTVDRKKIETEVEEEEGSDSWRRQATIGIGLNRKNWIELDWIERKKDTVEEGAD